MATPMISIDSIQFKRGTTENLNKWLDVPQCGEPIFDIDTKKLKIGDGKHLYKDLPFVGDGGSSSDQIVSKSHYEFPAVGEINKLYVATDECNSYIWTGNKYAIVSVDGREIDAGGAGAQY